MSRPKLFLSCLAACVLAGGVAGAVGVDPVTSGIVGFGAAGLAFAALSRSDRSDR
jgi:hypothetical protein